MVLLKILLYTALIIVVNELIQWVLRKLLKVERKKIFSYNYVNGLHRRIDWMIRITLMIASIIAICLTAYGDYAIYLNLVVLICFSTISASVNAFFEWKYSATPKQAIVTISEIVYIVIVVASIIQFDLLGFLI